MTCCPCKVAKMSGSTAGVVSEFSYECHSYSSTQCCFDLEVAWKLNSQASVHNLHTKSNIVQQIYFQILFNLASSLRLFLLTKVSKKVIIWHSCLELPCHIIKRCKFFFSASFVLFTRSVLANCRVNEHTVRAICDGNQFYIRTMSV